MNVKLVKFLHLRRYLCNASGGTNMSTVPQLRRQGLLGYMLHTGGNTLGVVYNESKDIYGLISVSVSNKDSYNKAKGREILKKCVKHLAKSRTAMTVDDPQEVLVPLAQSKKVSRAKANIAASILNCNTRLTELRNLLAQPRQDLPSEARAEADAGIQKQIAQVTAALAEHNRKLEDFDLSKEKFEYRFCWYSSVTKLTSDLMSQANVPIDVVFEPLHADGCYQLTRDGISVTYRLVVLDYKNNKHSVAFVSTDAPFNRFNPPVEISSLFLTESNRRALGLENVMLRPFKEHYVLATPPPPHRAQLPASPSSAPRRPALRKKKESSVKVKV